MGMRIGFPHAHLTLLRPFPPLFREELYNVTPMATPQVRHRAIGPDFHPTSDRNPHR